MNNDRVKHSISVARKMVKIAQSKHLSTDEINNCFLIGYVHDIGYEFIKDGMKHNIIGGEILKNSGFKFWQEVYYHGEINPTYTSLYLDILNQADMQIDKDGNDVGYVGRLKDIEERYGKDSDVYKNCQKLINKLKDSMNI